MNTSVELISIGSELLSGRTLNTHAQTLGTALSELGLQLSRDTTIPDELDLIQSAVRDAFERVDTVVVSGGLGPTPDDITRDALAGLFGCKIITSHSALEAMTARYAVRGRAVTSVSIRQVQILEGAETLLNSAGAAPGQRFCPEAGKTLFVLPGPPGEFAAVLQDHIIPGCKKTFPDVEPLEVRVITTKGIGESDVITRLEKRNFTARGIAVGFYPGGGKLEIRLTAPQKESGMLNFSEQTLREILREYLID